MEPKYKLIYQTLKNKILSHQINVGDKLPSENQLAKEYSVSRITSKRALTELENDGLVSRQAGIGTIVQKDHLTEIKNEILFVIPFANNAEFGDYTSGLLEVFNEQQNFQITTVTNQKFRNFPLSRVNQAKGIIYYVESLTNDLKVITKLFLDKIPIVILDKSFDDLPIPSVTCDNFNGGKLAATTLLQSGLQKLAFVTNENSISDSSVRSRYFGFLSAVQDQNKITPVLFNIKDHDISTLIADIKVKKVDGIVAQNDVVAIRIMNQLHQSGIKIPEDVSIIGFDNIQASTLSYPALTTIEQNFVTLGASAAKLLLQLIEAPKQDIPSQTIIPVKLIKRDSDKS
ncbi:GntR family transcriptional regulator [Companilactobacillus suantsaicola]|uniref:GntR family transcriptional regulator n=1 Tax=Companilactobacillus suantsaicola TaxID=2487723 RepID=A0A4Z0JQ84_9LACO|nr:substrate-binding domain-containing protein [Companilactobacillus suantsaicola]TGD25134.1 GntR family transcriptional regulator [Companilactobacillus suantsaicola]